MKIQVLGLGVVGLAQAYLLNRLGHSVYGFDIVKRELPEYIKAVDPPVRDVHFTFVCVPTQNVEESISMLVDHKVGGLYVIKSTVPPETAEDLMEKYDVHICSNPEFLREAFSYEDALNPVRLIIGACCREHGDMLRSLYLPLRKPIFMTTTVEAETVKLIADAYSETMTGFWSEMYELTKKGNLDINLAKMVTEDKRYRKLGTKMFGKTFRKAGVGSSFPNWVYVEKEDTVYSKKYVNRWTEPSLIKEWFAADTREEGYRLLGEVKPTSGGTAGVIYSQTRKKWIVGEYSEGK